MRFNYDQGWPSPLKQGGETFISNPNIVKWGKKSIKQPLSKLIHVYVAGNSNQITKIDVLKLVNTRRSKQFVVISSTSQKLG